MPKAEGLKLDYGSEDLINQKYLETFPFNSPNQYIITETDEFSAVCPFSGLPDYSYLKIEYFPEGGKCVELKSLKYYIISFRNVGIYQEAATKRIYDDLKKLLDTKKIQVTTIYNTRGGFDTTCIEGSLD
ncbi:MAG: NADPH-dependent 7-cyano-7-deazaguanine reductase QueF [Candidatus Marinimicrobia bacterium]|nr:NADPH-dependent 7-cyano-7-deazaguanine reductase QueF [Candidatus Neomarinimicrobiota bacterium]MEC7936223.1 preQ(1) synthase [Candidatus Neomarinimicrobiota bacterium]|tara:strand:+ start:60 stop:449 length:390 start_codon:yes stop_codon:yes gene_type:complete